MDSPKKTPSIAWHPAFASALQLELAQYKDILEFQTEYPLTDEPLKIDVLIIKKTSPIPIQKNIGAIFASHNIIEYKSPKDYLSIDDYYKVKAYVYLYKVITGTVDEVKLHDLTMTLLSKRYPKKLMKHIQEDRNNKICKQYPGIYYVVGEQISTQIIVQKELSSDENLYLSVLTDELRSKCTATDASRFF